MASPVPADNTNQLKIKDLSEVLDSLRRHGYSGVSYYDLGLYLGLSSATLDVIKENNKDNVESCLRECLTKWLQKADDVVKRGGPTIYSLVSALRKLKENAVAEGIDMEKHPACRIFACASNQSLVSSLPELATSLHSEMLIKEMMSINIPGETLLIQIKEAVCNDYKKLEALAVILCKVTITADIGYAIHKEYRKIFCSADLIKSNDDNVESLEIYLPQSLNSDLKSMRFEFVKIFLKVKSVMMKYSQSSTLDDIKYMLSIYDKALRPLLDQCQDTNSILLLISENCSLDDISMLEFVVDQLNINDVKVVIQEYNKTIQEFSEAKLSQYLEEKFAYASPLESETIVIVVDKDASEAILDDVKRLSSATFENLSQHVKKILVKRAKSYAITFSFPLILSEQLITAALNNIDVLKENKVKRLTIGYCTVYEVNDTSTPTTTEIDEYTSSSSTSSGLMKQLMLSLSVQLINSTEEVTTLNEKNIAVRTEAESCKELLDTKIRMLKASLSENEKLKTKASETSQLLQEKVSHLTEREEENENLKEIKEILEEQLALFQSEKEDKENTKQDSKEIVQLERSLLEEIEEIQLLKLQLASYQEEKEGEEETLAEEIKKLHSKTDKDEMKDKIRKGLLHENEKLKGKIEELQKELKQKDEDMQQEKAVSKQEIELLQEKITTMNLQQIEKDKQVQEKEQMLILKIQNLEKALRRELIFDNEIYGDIVIDHPLIIKIVKTHQFQRLKDIKKLGYTYQTIPKANYSRLQHSIGMYYLAGEYVKQLQKRQPELDITESDVLCVQIAALCYNLGHGPFSHIFEMFLDEFDRRWRNVPKASVEMFECMLEDNKDLMASFEEYNLMKDIAFIKEIILGVGHVSD